MIPVAPAPEPPDFDARVRQRGLSAIAELAGEPPAVKRPGPPRQPVAARREDIPPEKFPAYWREVLPQMLASYNRLCAYLALHIEPATGNPSIDHVVPKSRAWDRVYEWSNYRLACSFINAKKNNLDLALDPFTIQEGWFALELVEFQVKPGPAAGMLSDDVVQTIETLGLNRRECCDARRAYFDYYTAGEISLAYLERRAPFVAREMRLQGRLRASDG
jgi:5-methylcytosine-specific restriction endonuclease McrA